MKKIFHQIKNPETIHNTLKIGCEGVEVMVGRKVMLIAMLILTVLLAGCGGEKKPTPSAKKIISIGVSVTDMQRNGNQTIKKLLEQEAKKDGAKLTWRDAQGDPAQQKKQIQKLIDAKVQVAIIQTSDPSEGAQLIDTLATNNIKVIALESLPGNTPVDAYLTSDHHRTGNLQAHYLKTLIQQAQQHIQQGEVLVIPQSQGGKEQQAMTIPAAQQLAVNMQADRPVRVVILQGDPSDQMAVAITEAVTSGLAELANVEVVLTQAHPRWDKELAFATVEQVAKDNGGCDVVLANDSSLAMAAVEALKQSSQDRRVITVGAGADLQSIKALQSH